MYISDILKQQIIVSYPDANCWSENELIGIDIEGCGRLHVNKKLEIHIAFQEMLHADDNIIQLFFSPRVKANSEYMRIYFSRFKFQAYRKTMGVKQMGRLDMAMEYFLVFKNMHDSLIEFNSYK